MVFIERDIERTILIVVFILTDIVMTYIAWSYNNITTYKLMS